MGKIKFGEKLSFFVANVGNIPVMTLISSFLLIFYTDIVGLNPVAVGTLFLLTKLLDGINDPIVGFLLDRMPRRKNGKFKPILAIGAVMCSINFALIWFGPALAPASMKMLVAYITYICIGITFDIMDISLNCMIPVMTSDMKERTSLSSIKGAGYMLGTVVVSIGAPLVINAFETKANGYYVLITVTCIVVLVLSLIGAFAVKERVAPIKDENYSLKQLFSFLLVGPVFTTFISQLLFIGGKSLATASEVYFATYILDKFSIVALLSAITLIGMVPAVFVSGFLVRRFGKRLVYSAGILIFSLAGLLRLIDYTNITLLYAAYIILGFGAGTVMVLMYGIQADNIDYVELIKGSRAEGAISSLQSFVAKAGGAIGGSLPAYVLAWTGYVANQEQTASAKTGIVVSTLIIPAILGISAALVFLFCYKLDGKTLDKTQAELAKLRSEKKAGEL